MNDTTRKGLLPAGLADGLPPQAKGEAILVERLVAAFDANGYDRVKPPLIEFEDSLLDGPGVALAPQMFRVMDPVSQRMMGLRADITPQVARIATTRLARAARPLRLSYAGQVLRVRGSQLRPERQFAQAGVELIGAEGIPADAEVVLLAVEALQGVEVARLSVDLTLPTLVPAVCRGLGLDAEASARARDALDRKDAGALVGFENGAGEVFRALLAAGGPAAEAIARLERLSLPDEAAAMRSELAELVATLAAAVPDVLLTVDPTEYRGFEYQTGVSFTLFARGVRGELGRGGRYHLSSGEPAIGFTLYLDSLARAVPAAAVPERIYLPYGTGFAAARELRRQGWRTRAGLVPEQEPKAEAERHGCSHILQGGAPTPL
ncbi:ATP phosphoribosyltransferase regulatory subunit [Oceanibacterium hippocampi]|uniref:ATP phosphoribosyltransferase regulatory subunit n=1 Tax=Oceanibacterium hippocampi TaxID=745714 RepID=A0A1Y5TUI0_9PROT|nr:ATP phosphoribosyltransferase regulatory subunit [Oceanibacterium hippocampi]SLN73109.1 ATP phosphoribosyltransferase regulatory subunit [Oceanibacterium hippocampi]